jgi:hypothetical protein
MLTLHGMFRWSRVGITGLAVGGATVHAAMADEGARADTSSSGVTENPQEPLTAEAELVVTALRAALSADDEGRLMLEDIVSGRQLGPGDGWFKVAHAQTRYPADAVLKRYDSDGDGAVSREEFGGTDEDFQRLDRDGDAALREADFDWSEHSLARSPGLMLFFTADRDANGKVTREEFAGLFERFNSGDHEFLSLDDLRNQFQPPPDRPQARPDEPSRSTLVLGLARQEIGSLQHGPALDEPAPDFTLKTVDGQEVTLANEVGERPVVLIFGNFTCGPFRSQAGNIEKLYERYKDRASFFLIYVREAHPSDGWWMLSNQRVGVDLPQPTTDPERQAVAQTCRNHLDLDIPFLVDSIDDSVGATYSGMPNRLYLIDRNGNVAFKCGRGPFGFHPRQLEQALVLLLNE